MVADLPIKKCTLAKFSHGGHLFAAVGRTNVIMVGALKARLKGRCCAGKSQAA